MAVAKVLRSRQKAMAKTVDGQGVSRTEVFAPWPRILDPETKIITAHDAALAAMSLLDTEIRDAMISWLCPGMLNVNEFGPEVQELFCGLEPAWGEEHCDLEALVAQNAAQDALIHLSAMLPDHVAAPALSVLASFVWWRGDGALARVALDRALRCDADYRLVSLLQQMIDLAIRPVAV